MMPSTNILGLEIPNLVIFFIILAVFVIIFTISQIRSSYKEEMLQEEKKKRLGYYKVEPNIYGYCPMNTFISGTNNRIRVEWESIEEEIIMISSSHRITMSNEELEEIEKSTPEIRNIKLKGSDRLIVNIPKMINFEDIEENLLIRLFKHLNEQYQKSDS